MANIVLEKLVKNFGKQTAVKDLSLEINDKEFIALLGPSGCGKTTTMNMISGLLKPDSGKIFFDGKLMNPVPPGKRGVGFMFQNYAVFTFLNVFDNISFGLRIRNVPKVQIDKAVNEVARLLQIRHLLNMSASSLSINDMQRVALARSMITKPQIFLLDEPLSNLDASLRAVMRAELKKIQQELGQTAIYVTHDQVEAMSLADRIAVMNFAVLQQYDTPHNVYNRPKNLFVANFIGSPTINFFEGVYRTGEFLLSDFSGGRISVSSKQKNEVEERLKQEKIVVGIRPEHLKVCDTEKQSRPKLKAKVVSYEPLGSRTVVYMHPDSNPSVIIKSAMGSGYKPKIGELKFIDFEEKALYLFDRETEDLAVRFS
ncbi:MAG TPA: ABC transporter ATP-binding protein [Spirochaetota bacterium]|nr:ABC transporter ATP-binding protein [Spirochaetota bacterium]